jgi:hypothetical protein
VLGIGVCAAFVGAAAAYFHDSRVFGLLAYIAYFGALRAVATRMQKVTIIDEGLLLKAGYTGGLFCQWSEIVAIEPRHFGPLKFDQLQFAWAGTRIRPRQPGRSARIHLAANPKQASHHRGLRQELADGSDRHRIDCARRLARSNPAH